MVERYFPGPDSFPASFRPLTGTSGIKRDALIQWVLVVCLFCVWAGTFSSTAVAQAPTQNESHEELIRMAVDEFDRSNFAEARELFRKAHAMEPTARTFRALGLVEFELRNYGEAASMLEQSLASAIKPLHAKQRVETEKLLERTRGYLGTVHVATDPSPATVIVDGAAVELGPSGTLVLEVGEHVLEFHAEGRLPEKQRVNVKGGQTESLRVTLRSAVDPSAVAVSAQANPTQIKALAGPPQQVDQPLRKKWWVWTAVGVVTAAAVITATVVLTRDDGTKTKPFDSENTPPGASIQSLIQGAR